MSQRKSPNLKKQDELDHDHRCMAENPKAFRKNWPRKKARIHRKYRRGASVVVQTAALEEISAATSELSRRERQWRPKKWGVMTLRKWIENRRVHRVAMIGQNKRNAEAAAAALRRRANESEAQ